MYSVFTKNDMFSQKLSIAKDFHETTKFQNKVQKNYTNILKYKEYINTENIKLLNIDVDMNDSFLNCLINRKSTRYFSEVGVSLNQLSYILNLSYGINTNSEYSFRRSPSAGGIYPLEIYTIIFNGIDISNGLYHYNIKDNSLEFLKQGDFRNILYEFCHNQDCILSCSALFIISSVFDRNMEKYGERGYRYILFDAGHLCQNMYLTSTYLNLGFVSLGGFQDNKINNFLGIDGKYETSLYIGCVGSV